MKRKKAIAVILTAALITGSVFGIGVAVRKTTSGNSAVTVIQGSNINTGYWGNDTQSMNGTVSSSATQNVYLNSGDTVQSVNVKAGDTVKAGDVLLKYDPAKAELAFKGEQISYDEIQLKIKVAQQNLNTLSKIKPVADLAAVTTAATLTMAAMTMAGILTVAPTAERQTVIPTAEKPTVIQTAAIRRTITRRP